MQKLVVLQDKYTWKKLQTIDMPVIYTRNTNDFFFLINPISKSEVGHFHCILTANTIQIPEEYTRKFTWIVMI